jgi:hypothetical protein
MNITDINESIAYIKDGEEYFQVLNADGDDWDEALTAELYKASQC